MQSPLLLKIKDGSEDEDDGESCKNERKEESDEDGTDLFEDISGRLGENLNIEREADQSESSFNSNTVRPAPDVDENVNLDLSVGSESESQDENMALYDADTEVDDGPDVDFVVDLNQDQQNYYSGQWQKNTNGFPKLPRCSAQPGIKVTLPDDPSPLEVYKLFITDELINSWKVKLRLIVTPEPSSTARTNSSCPTAAGSNGANLSLCGRCGNFIAICIHMGLGNKPTLHDYWTRHPVLHSSFAPKVIVRERILSIVAFLHINDNATIVPQGQPDYDPIQKIKRSDHSSTTSIQSSKRFTSPSKRKNRVGMPADLFQNRQRQGDFDFRRKSQLVTTRWFEKREVVTLSTIHQPPLTEPLFYLPMKRR
ncbi:PiggyBac transposase uribo2 [Plakobranchus ocellatus]|uniref:PiggyBac transposase uribo2 n=1 Tax=Plakobranchus ocellatus TaxID=259542 RepID=A0AAV4AIR8_9GAST|nr:PiggyBac transposase uribo2 [Plakobranchus ocellatus]